MMDELLDLEGYQACNFFNFYLSQHFDHCPDLLTGFKSWSSLFQPFVTLLRPIKFKYSINGKNWQNIDRERSLEIGLSGLVFVLSIWVEIGIQVWLRIAINR